MVGSAVGSWTAAVMAKSRTWSRAITTITSPRRISSDDMRYARRSAAGAAVASLEDIGGLATFGWIELIMTFIPRSPGTCSTYIGLLGSITTHDLAGPKADHAVVRSTTASCRRRSEPAC